MEGRITLIITRDGEEGSENPYRTGIILYIKEEVFQKNFTPEVQSKVYFMPERVARQVGLLKEQNG
jgi:hypothetical protein